MKGNVFTTKLKILSIYGMVTYQKSLIFDFAILMIFQLINIIWIIGRKRSSRFSRIFTVAFDRLF